MRSLPREIGPIHFVGIGGIGMSGIAETLKNLGYEVQGSDQSENANVRRLRQLGVKVMIGHDAKNLGEAAVVVVSSAVKTGNPEIDAARAGLIPVVRRAEMLAELMRLKWSIAVGGTHGKTTTTSMIGWLLEGGGFDPTVINGGIINAYGTNAKLGAGEWMVVESDESDGSFVKLPATICVVTNIDPEHLDHYGDFNKLRAAFRQFVENIPFYGFAVLCVDHPEVQAMMPDLPDRRLIAYGFSPQADVRGINVQAGAFGARFSVQLGPRMKGGARIIENLSLPMFGQHNILNSLAAIALAVEMGIPEAAIRDSLSRFQGVSRRFTKTGIAGGVTVIDDYGHHPVEIAAVLKAARQAVADRPGARVIAVVQPHRYSRLKSLFEEFCTCFNDADSVLVAPVYSAGEAPIAGADHRWLVAGLKAHGHRDAEAIAGPEALPETVLARARPGDYVVCLGAGSITGWAHALPGALETLLGGKSASGRG